MSNGSQQQPWFSPGLAGSRGFQLALQGLLHGLSAEELPRLLQGPKPETENERGKTPRAGSELETFRGSTCPCLLSGIAGLALMTIVDWSIDHDPIRSMAPIPHRSQPKSDSGVPLAA